MPKPAVLAVAAHPDDIEFMMAGTLALLGQAGYDLHYLNVANGSMGTSVDTRDVIIAKRTEEARHAAETLGATFHEPLVDDLDIFFDRTLCRGVCAVIREVRPAILLIQSPQDYMEDHMNAGRLAVSAAFYRGMRNYITDPPRKPITNDVTLYHALPYGLRDSLRRRVRAGQYIDISPVLKLKRKTLACHKSQKEWLDVSQGLDSYLITMEDMSREAGDMSGVFEYAEGWRRRHHLGFCAEGADPLADALGDRHHRCDRYEAQLNE